MPTDGLCTAHAAILSDNNLDPDFAGDIHAASNLRVRRSGLAFELSLTLVIHRLRTDQRESEPASRYGDKDLSRPIESDLHHSLLRRKSTPRKRRQVQCQGRRGKTNSASIVLAANKGFRSSKIGEGKSAHAIC
jgi:hypothetical protein